MQSIHKEGTIVSLLVWSAYGRLDPIRSVLSGTDVQQGYTTNHRTRLVFPRQICGTPLSTSQSSITHIIPYTGVSPYPVGVFMSVLSVAGTPYQIV
jgi:hypothetical protein